MFLYQHHSDTNHQHPSDTNHQHPSDSAVISSPDLRQWLLLQLQVHILSVGYGRGHCLWLRGQMLNSKTETESPETTNSALLIHFKLFLKVPAKT